MSQPLTPAEFEALVKRAGLDLTPANIADLYSAWPHIERFTARLRNRHAGGRRSRPTCSAP